MYTLFREQYVHTTLAEVWNFLKNPSNLNLITPDDVDFKIITDVPEEMYNGLLVEYRIKIPFIGVHKWVAEIKHICEYGFVDEQRVGPYKFWYHYHELVEQEHRVKIIDRVYYDLPFGLAGKAMHAIFIKKILDRIFQYRRQRINEYLNQ
ncbi:MAG: SRPBCC family protein [Desulfobulbaceae bacterium]|uniref:SRPBCC family protein n=1 Tax=Candidatus Desulfobia pelagia TaxID=2841692 RepID=A0A8J6NGN5_9BACT|nr:SRPBCC family protein [Candidatus Desulfobia pelagia]